MNLKQLLLILAVYLIPSEKIFASISIDSVITTTSSCSNNGTATVYASSIPAGTLLYAITSGPILAPIQNSNIFSSLYPGNYNLRVYDINFDSLDYQFQITGNYQLPDFTLTGIDPTCPGFTDGSINVLVDSTKGLSPYTYEIISPIVVPSQSSNFFPNLSNNTYFVRVTDACGNYQTRTEILFNTGTELGINTFIIPVVSKIGCDTIRVSTYLYLLKEKWNQPITVTYNTTAGTITKQATLTVIDTINSNPGLFEVTDTLAGLTYGDYLNIQFSDVCGITVSSAINTISPFEFDLLFSPTTVNCVSTFSAYAELKHYPNYPYDYTYPMIPLSFIMTDGITGLVVDSGSCTFPYCYINLIAQTPGNSYNLTITDGCGDVWQEIIVWPTAGAPLVNAYHNLGCLDSTASLTFECLGFQSQPWITILSGPSNAGSTKPFYAYNEPLIYPQTFFGTASPNVMYLKDFPKGLYTFQVEDSCGNIVPGTFLVEDYMVSNLSFSWYVKPSCLNNNTLYYNFQEGSGAAIYASLTNLATNQVLAFPPLNYFLDSITTLPVGNYALEIYYLNRMGSGQHFDGGLVTSGISCWVLHDTIRITPYANNFFITNSTIYCNGDYYVSLEVDSTRGVPPYRFAIISGPQTFPLQDSAFFQISAFGNYVISMEDVCGNNYTQQISVTSDSLPPMVRGGFFCEGNFASLSLASSPYFMHSWEFPNGSTFIGDSILFQPFTSADTGQYTVTTYVSINGCLDSLTSGFHLSGKDSVSQSRAICPGDSISVGPNVYYNPGVYRDTLSTFLGCDSVIITTLSFQTILIDSISISICAGDSLLIGSNYYSLSGTYVDTVLVPGNCEKIIITQLTANPLLDSISAVICQGDTFRVGNIIHISAGVFTDTLTSILGCDSLVVVDISVTPFLIDSNNISICAGDSLLIGNNYYSSSGIFADTLLVSGNCKKIVITQLSVNTIIDSISAVICQGDTFRVGNIIHLIAGVFTDTLTAASGCDSLVVLDLSVTPFLIDSNNISICAGDSILIGNNYYSSSGIYTDTLLISGNCKKIVITQLSVNTIIDSISAVICQGDTFRVGNIIHISAGVFTDTLTAASGCDSLVVVDISITPFIIDSNNISICVGDSVLIGNNYYSSSGIFTDTLLVSGNCKKIVITQLSVNTIIYSISAVICQGDTFRVGNIIHISAGVFTDTLTAASGCDSIVVSDVTLEVGGTSTLQYTICYGDSFYFRNTYINTSGTYYDTLSTSNCDSVIALQLTVLPMASILITINTTSIVSGVPIQLSSNSLSGWNYTWTGNAQFDAPYSNITTATLDSTAWIYLTIMNSSGCIITDSILLIVFEELNDSCEFATIFIPNAFTPNEDGINDMYEIKSNHITVKNYRIFNRWGESIFESSENEKKWDGKFKSKRCPSGIYVYIVDYEDCNSKKRQLRKGFLTLLD